MKYRYLGQSGLAVSNICLGTMTFGQEGWGTSREVSEEILDVFVDEGGNFIDTADKYADTKSESIIGEWLSSKTRDELVIGSKCFFPTSSASTNKGLSRKHVISACEASLSRLQTDYIDLYQLHAPDPYTPIEETLSALDMLTKQGKIRYTGISNFPAWQLTKAQFLSASQGYSRFISGQYQYNLLKRDIETDVLPACVDSGAGVLCWSPLSGGMLTGKYPDSDQPPKDTRLSARSDLAKGRYREWFEKSGEVVNKILEVAERREVKPAVVSLAWLLGRSGVASVIAGASRSQQVQLNCSAAALELNDEEIRMLDDVSNSAPRYPQAWIKATHAEVFKNHNLY